MAKKQAKKIVKRQAPKHMERSKSRAASPSRKAAAGMKAARKSRPRPPALATAVAEVSASQSTLTDGQCDNIASDSVRRITGSKREYSRSDQLQQYGVNTDQQCRAIVDLIIGDPAIGVGRYDFKIVDASKISGLASSWTMGQLANTIQSSAIPV
jgi:hypothetical protein